MKNVIDFIPIGRENAVSMEELAIRMGVCKRTARKLVFEARRKNAVICSTCNGDKSDGYFRPTSAEEAMPYIRLQKSRILSAKIALRSAEDFVNGEENA